MLIEESSAISRTNQLQILANQDIGEKLHQYLFKADKGIECFPLQYPPANNKDSEEENSQQDISQSDFFTKRHIHIKKEVQKRLAQHGKEIKYGDIQYLLSYSNGKNNLFFLSPNKNDSRWKPLFSDNQEKIFNLVLKFYLLDQVFPSETIDSFEELFFLHSKSLTKSKALVVWGQNLLVKYNHHDILTLTLTRKRRIFLLKDKKDYKTLDGDDLGELIVYKNKNYYFNRNLDARHSNSIHFMDFRRGEDDEKYDKFKKTQLYYYQNLMIKLEDFLRECDIKFKVLDFQADYYLENPFIKNIEAVESLEIINNTGIDLTQGDQQFLQNFLKHQGVSVLTFYNLGNTISIYEKQEVEGEDDPCWQITEIIPWSAVELEKQKNYLIFNKLLEEEVGSMAYQNDSLWYPSTKLDDKSQIDFYSQLKKKYNYLDTGEFYSIQGINISQFKIVQEAHQGRKKEKEEKNLSVISYPSNIDLDLLQQDCQTFSNGQFLDKEESVTRYLIQQDNTEEWAGFYNKYKLKIAPEFQKVLIELGIKNWIRKSIIDPNFSLPITNQSIPEQQFWAIYVRSPKNKEAKAVAVEFLYQSDRIYLKSIMRDLKEIKRKFKFLRKRKNSEKLINDQQYFVDELKNIYISCYTSDSFTPTLIGRHGIIEDLENGTLEVNKTIKGEDASKLLPLVSYYNSQTDPIKKIKDRICLDLHNETFIQYYVPPASNINRKIEKGFRVYHLIGNTYSGDSISTSKLIEHPIVSLHFNTLTQNVLKISENSQSSLLQKITKILIEN